MLDIENSNKNLLFKFIPVNINLIRLLVNSSIWYSPFHKLNDPFEGAFSIESAPLPDDEYLLRYYEQMHKFSYGGKKISNMVRKIHNDESVFYRDLQYCLRSNHFTKLKVACFSLTYREILLWSHYADEHRGVCLIFDKATLLKKNDLTEDRFTLKGKQVRPRSKKKIRLSFDKLPGNRIGIGIKNRDEVIFKKLPCWKYEQEFRILMEEDRDVQKDGTEAPFVKSGLRGIIFGERCKTDDVRLVYKMLNTYNYVDSDFFWGVSRIVPTTGKLTVVRDRIKTERDLLDMRMKWLRQFFLE